MKIAYSHRFRYVCNNLNDCIKSSYFTELIPSILVELLAYKSKRRDEKLLFQRLLAWVYSNKDIYDEKKMVNLMMEIDFEKISMADFELILFQNAFVLKIPDCLAFFREKIK